MVWLVSLRLKTEQHPATHGPLGCDRTSCKQLQVMEDLAEATNSSWLTQHAQNDTKRWETARNLKLLCQGAQDDIITEAHLTCAAETDRRVTLAKEAVGITSQGTCSAKCDQEDHRKLSNNKKYGQCIGKTREMERHP